MNLGEYIYLMKRCDILVEYPEKENRNAEFYYQNTKLLLENYRRIKFILTQESTPLEEIKNMLPADYESYDDDKLTRILKRMANEELEGRHIRNHILLTQITLAMEKLKSFPGDGETYYAILYNAYIRDTIVPTETIMKMRAVSLGRTAYFRKKNQAIEILSNILWGDCSKMQTANCVCPFCGSEILMFDVGK